MHTRLHCSGSTHIHNMMTVAISGFDTRQCLMILQGEQSS